MAVAVNTFFYDVATTFYSFDKSCIYLDTRDQQTTYGTHLYRQKDVQPDYINTYGSKLPEANKLII